MKKITELVKKGWQVSIMSDSQGWFEVAFTHNIWEEAEGYAETLTEAINQAYKNAKKEDEEMYPDLIKRFGRRKVNAAIEALREGGNEPAYVDILVELEAEE